MSALPAGTPAGKAASCICGLPLMRQHVGCALRTVSSHDMFDELMSMWPYGAPQSVLPITRKQRSPMLPTIPNRLNTLPHRHADETSNMAMRKLAPRAHASPDSNECHRHAAQNQRRRVSGVPRNAVATILLPAACYAIQIDPAHRTRHRILWRRDA